MANQPAKRGKPAKTQAEKDALKNESKAVKFVRLAKQRVPKAIKAIENVAKLAHSNYESTPAQIIKINDALTAALAQATARLNGQKTAQATFDL